MGQNIQALLTGIKVDVIMSFLEIHQFFAIAVEAVNVSHETGINLKKNSMKVLDWVHHFSLKTEQLNKVHHSLWVYRSQEEGSKESILFIYL